MAAVAAPDPTYKPTLSQDLITRGDLSELQLEAIVYAGRRTSIFSPIRGRRRRGSAVHGPGRKFTR